MHLYHIVGCGNVETEVAIKMAVISANNLIHRTRAQNLKSYTRIQIMALSQTRNFSSFRCIKIGTSKLAGAICNRALSPPIYGQPCLAHWVLGMVIR